MNSRRYGEHYRKPSIDKMSTAELQDELADLAPKIAEQHDHYGPPVGDFRPMGSMGPCPWLYCRIAERVRREIASREKSAVRRSSSPAGTSFCACGCRCDNLASMSGSESGYCRSCENGMCGE